jgi:hypothetical protein
MASEEKATEVKKAPAKRVSVSKKQLNETAQAVELGSKLETAVGIGEVAEGMETLDEARVMVRVSAASMASASSNLTRAEDAALVSERMAQMSAAVGEAGVMDYAQGEAMLAESDNVKVLSAMVGMMGENDLEAGLALARVAGELWAVGDVVHMLEMPVLASFLNNRSALLKGLAVKQVLRSASATSLSEMMAASGQKLAALGTNEAAEGLARMMVSDALSERSGQLAEASEELAVMGITDAAMAQAAANTAREMVKEGVAGVAEGAANLGSGAALGGVAEALKEKAK